MSIGAMSVEQVQSAVKRIDRRLEELHSFDPYSIQKIDDPRLIAMRADIGATLAGIFGRGAEYNRYAPAARLSDGGINIRKTTPISERRQTLATSHAKSIALLQSARRALTERLEDIPEPILLPISEIETIPTPPSRRVFVVHGHDEAAKFEMASFLKSIDFEPIILHEQANGGKTIIEKIEDYGDCGFAVVLLTPDDVGSKAQDSLQPRARQNVILELGYFIGRLGRPRVAAFKKGSIEVPTDFAGVVYNELDPQGAWKQLLARELKQADYNIDWNKVMR